MGTRWDEDWAKWIPKRVQELAKSWTGAGGFMCFVGLHNSTRQNTFYKGTATYRMSFLGLHASAEKATFNKGPATYRFYTRTDRGRAVPERFGSETACVPFGSSSVPLWASLMYFRALAS